MTLPRTLVCCLLLCCATAQAATYRWVDPTGRVVISDTPPPGRARALTRTTTPETGQPGGELPFATRRAAEAFPVTLYTAASCAAECQQARTLLTGRGIPFTERGLNSPAEFDELKQLVGDAFVPSLKVGKQSSRGFESNSWHNLLDLAGYPKTTFKKAPATP